MRIMGMAGDQTGCGYFRVYLPLGELKRRGHTVVFSGKQDARGFDIIVGQRVSNEASANEWLTLSKLPRAYRGYRLVFEIDDDLWNVQRSNEPAWKFYCEDPARLDRLRRCCEVSDLVTTTTEPLAETLRAMTPAPVVVIPNYCDEQIFNVRRKQAERLTIGCGGSMSHAGDWAGMPASGIDRFLRKNPDVLLHFIGCEFVNLLSPSVRPQVRVTQWQMQMKDYYQSLIMDIGLAPLAGNVFNDAKSALKVMEYSMLGVVPVFSDELPYRGFPGLRCTTANDWYSALRQLKDPAERDKLRKECLDYCCEMTIQRNAHKWLRAYESVL